MLQDNPMAWAAVACILILSGMQVAKMIYRRSFHPLKSIPGPLLASVTNLWYFNSTVNCISRNLTLDLHQRYGKYVRVAPNCVQTCDPDSLEAIYSVKSGFTKSDFYALFDPHISQRTDMFCETDEKEHSRRRRDVAGLYTAGTVLSYESRTSGLVDLFCQRLDNEPGSFDLAVLVRRFTFDVIGEIFYGKDGGFGFLRDNIDYNDWMFMLDRMMPVGASMSFLPRWARSPFFAIGMLSREIRYAVKGFDKVVEDAKQAVTNRLSESMEEADNGRPRHDALAQLLEIVRDRGKRLDFNISDVQTELWMMIYSGADTSAFAFASVFYHLLKYPTALRKLQQELDHAFASGALSHPVKHADAIKLPYLDACIMEGIRLHPPVGLMIPRVVPAGGREIGGYYFPEGTIVGIQASAMHRNIDAFGEDAEDFVPERWLRHGPEAAQAMERKMLMWGAGSHTCVGKQIAQMEIFKLLPTVMHLYDFTLMNPTWNVVTSWFHRVTDVQIIVKRRHSVMNP